ncbi:hypothetical protein PHYBLDRAFT_166157 [Phycomyces blakesleeanus NRRL 1555(-)]|uniref:Uncharacterized protein n=1 Tax=Phycomyces blakesleeanus (strain ATCC 8743b / DSM 1359 / FGSC 10004 / NBRC 33097 / NRRL 1555) TaxID=763407 RepID=A0A167NLA3_PHYB8|nr:hypothetical protein PHYBLDRAFT_166157 [Phycomyces blakesleeanus NRRL 1555(-)]OAD76184.1 hypothetical protein PHYBLDRAFT_166157 [Phycomyces blakesleeanus NRRL 1555(-)]|eukprot:XP_018294224.1 hypothetical protein PHYBLDRAFT_166157 [Phycomyces blakesleeanus NRRL 1555(-)]
MSNAPIALYWKAHNTWFCYFYVRIRNRHRKIPYPIFLMELYIIDKPFLDSDFQDLGCTGDLGSLGSIYYIKGNKFQKIQANNMSLKGVPIDTELMHPGLPVTIECKTRYRHPMWFSYDPDFHL